MTMSKRRICDAYSVFVGRIPEDTTKHDLRKLFEGCGEIVDVVILQNGHAPHPYYGFVRFKDRSEALKAAEMHGTEYMNGRIVVQIEKHTAERIMAEKTGGDSGSRRKQPPANRMANVISNTRLVESCSLLKQSYGKDAPVSTSHIFDDMKKQRYRYERCAVPWASMDSKNTNFSNISHRIMKSCQEKCMSGDGEMLGKKRSEEFLSAFRTIMDEINSIDNVCGESSDENSGTTEASSKLTDISTENSQISSARLSETSSKSNINVTKNSTKLNMDTQLKEDKVVENEVAGIHGRLLDMKRSRRIVPYCEDDQSSSDSHSDMEQMVNYRSSVKRAAVSNTELSKTHAKRLQPAYYSSSEDNALSNFDPAIIDFNLSKLKEIKKSEQKVNNNDALEQLFSVQCRTETNDMVKSMARSSSFDSNTSSSSNDGRVDDSGVESDGRNSKRPLISRTDLVNSKVIGRGSRCLSGSSSPPLAPQRFSSEKSVPKPRGRGRGVLGLDLSTI